MKAVKPPIYNRVMSAPGCFDLPAAFDGEKVIVCWQPTFKERLRLLFGAKIWHHIACGQACRIQPVLLTLDDPGLQLAEPAGGKRFCGICAHYPACDKYPNVQICADDPACQKHFKEKIPG